MNKNELVEILLKHKDVPVFIECSFNQYEIDRIFLLKDKIILQVGEVNNTDT